MDKQTAIFVHITVNRTLTGFYTIIVKKCIMNQNKKDVLGRIEP
jgi:hypothetical protein